MSNLKEVTLPQAHAVVTPQERFELAQQISHKLAESSLVPDEYRGKPEDIFVAVQMGHDVGLSPFQAVQSICVINGKPSIYGDGLIGLVRGSGKSEYITEVWDEEMKEATCTTLRKGEAQPVTRQFSMVDASLAGLNKKAIWHKYPKRMCQMRARAWCLRDVYADVLKGLASAEEMQDVQSIEVAAEIEQERAEDDVPLKEIKTTLQDVLEDIAEAETMADLLKAGESAKKLWDTDDQDVARATYKTKRSAIKEKIKAEQKEEVDNGESE